MIHKVLEFINQNTMIKEKDRIVVGVSGGADSVCLFFVLLELQKTIPFDIVVVHVNHGLRGELANRDEAYVKELCDQNHIDFESYHCDINLLAIEDGLSMEEAGRVARYQAFHECMNKYHCNKIAVAHNYNDQAETVLFQLFRGSGLQGISGIHPLRDSIIRPLLCVTRQEIEAYLKKHSITFQTDHTNLETVYTRNKIRLELIPYIQREINKKAVEHIVASAKMIKEAADYIKQNTLNTFERIVIASNGQYSFDVEEFLKEDIVIQKELIRTILFKITNQLRDITNEHINMVLGLVDRQVGKKVNLPYDVEAVKTYSAIQIMKATKEKKEIVSTCVELDIPSKTVFSADGRSLSLSIIDNKKNLSIPKNSYTKWFDYDKITNTVFLRNRRVGDYLQIDSAGGHKKLKDYFINQKIPVETRDQMLLLADGSHIMWILGDRISEAYKVDETTNKILIAKIDGGKEDGRQNKCINF